MSSMASKTDLKTCERLLRTLQNVKMCDRPDLIIKSGVSASSFDKIKAIFLRIYEHDVDYDPDTKMYRIIDKIESG